MPLLFAFTLFISALLLFMVQPMIGRMILPLLGGSPAAWNTCMVFFQFMLLLGYLYAHKLAGRLALRNQVLVHLAVLTVAVGTLAAAYFLGGQQRPIHIEKSLAPQNSAYPMFGVIALLFVAIGVPFFAVSASAPLLTRWFSKTDHPAAGDPYFLYAASNAGSLLSLLAYPFIIEPPLRLNAQARLWGLGMIALLVLTCLCGWAAWRRYLPTNTSLTADGSDAHAPTTGRILKWILLAFVPSSLLLGVTFFITTDIASVPLFWIVPLALYLLTFIIAFARLPRWVRTLVANVAPVAALLLIFVIVSQQALPSQEMLIALHITTFFLLALMCHLELAHDRPPPKYLTNFFLWISLGGVLGGAFNALLAPLAFPLAYEYPIALGLACLLVPKLTADTDVPAEKAKRARLLDLLIPLGMLVLVANLAAYLDTDWMFRQCSWAGDQITAGLQAIGIQAIIGPHQVHSTLVYALPLILCFCFIDRPLRFGLCVAAVIFVGEFFKTKADATYAERSFFGILKISEWPRKNPDFRRLVHGTTLHGKQGVVRWSCELPPPESVAALTGAAGVYGFDWTKEPLTYYHRSGPVGHMFTVTRERHTQPNVAMVGLGTGSVSCYADSNMSMDYYEIDPTVKKLVADTDQFFTYVSDARARGAKIDFILGDARLKLEENTEARYDLLLVDAFSSDAIPVHLLTKEALEVYLNRLTPNGLLGLHISNKYVKLDAVVARLAQELNLHALLLDDSWHDTRGAPDCQISPPGKTQSSWVVLARDPALIEPFRAERFTTRYEYAHQQIDVETGQPREPPVNAWIPLKLHPEVRAWTDDYADVLLVMRMKTVQRLRHALGLPTLDELRQ